MECDQYETTGCSDYFGDENMEYEVTIEIINRYKDIIKFYMDQKNKKK